MAEVTGVTTSYTVTIDLSRVFDHDDRGAPVDLGTMLALVGSLAEDGHAPTLMRELLAFRDDRERVSRVHARTNRTVIAAGLEALEAWARDQED